MTMYLLIITTILLVFLYFLSNWKPTSLGQIETKKKIIFGHRGYPNLKAENTLPSFEEAFISGVDGIELDVQLSKDKQLVVFHDFDLTSFKQPEKIILELPYEEIKVLSNKFYNKTNTYIPLLSEVIDILPNNIVINIEIKTNQIFGNGIEKEVANLIKKANIEEQTLISSFNPLVLRKMKQIAPDLKTGYLWSKEDQIYWFLPHHWAYYCKPDTFHPDINFVTKKQIEWAHKKGMKAYAFTVNTDAQLHKVKLYKIDGVFTDDPRLLKDKL